MRGRASSRTTARAGRVARAAAAAAAAAASSGARARAAARGGNHRRRAMAVATAAAELTGCRQHAVQHRDIPFQTVTGLFGSGHHRVCTAVTPLVGDEGHPDVPHHRYRRSGFFGGGGHGEKRLGKSGTGGGAAGGGGGAGGAAGGDDAHKPMCGYDGGAAGRPCGYSLAARRGESTPIHTLTGEERTETVEGPIDLGGSRSRDDRAVFFRVVTAPTPYHNTPSTRPGGSSS